MAETQFIPCLVVLILIPTLAFPLAATPLGRRKSLETIKYLNKNGPYLGLITVFPPEEEAFFATGAFKPDPTHPFVDLSGRRYRVGKLEGKKVIYVRCGVGMVNAAAATQQILDVFDISGVVHFGIAGNANNSMSIGDVSIPQEVAHTGIWDWLKPNGTLEPDDVAHLDIGSYNVPLHQGINLLGRIGYRNEQFFSESGTPNTPQHLLWLRITQNWLHLAASLEGMKLEQCVNSSLCLPQKLKLVVGLRASTSNIFVDNAAYREFLFNTFQVSSVDMESSSVVMTSLSNGFPVIVIRGLSDLAGGQPGKNSIDIFGPLAALNTAKAHIVASRSIYLKSLCTDLFGTLPSSFSLLKASLMWQGLIGPLSLLSVITTLAASTRSPTNIFAIPDTTIVIGTEIFALPVMLANNFFMFAF